MDYKKLKETLGSLLNDKTSKEDEEVITGLIKDMDTCESETLKLAEACENYRKKYIESVTNFSTKDKPTPDVNKDEKPKSFEDCCKEVIEARKSE